MQIPTSPAGTPGSAEGVKAAYRMTAMIAGSFIMGMLLFAGVIVILGGSTRPETALPPWLRPAWFTLVAAALIAGLFVRNRITQLGSDPETMQQIQDGQIGPPRVHTWTMTMWAIQEMAVLFGLVLCLRGMDILTWVLAYIIVATALFFPRPAWFEVFQRSSRLP